MKKNCRVVLDTPRTTKTIQIHQRNKGDLSFGDLKIYCPPYNQTIIYYKNYSSPTMFANTLLCETIFLQPLFMFSAWFKFYTHHELQNLQPKLFYYLEKPKTLIVMGWCH